MTSTGLEPSSTGAVERAEPSLSQQSLGRFGLYALRCLRCFWGCAWCSKRLIWRFVQHGHPFMRWLSAVQWAGAAFGFAYMAFACWGIAGKLRFARAQFDDAGLSLRVGARKKPRESFFAWDQISEIDKQQVGTNWVITVTGEKRRVRLVFAVRHFSLHENGEDDFGALRRADYAAGSEQDAGEKGEGGVDVSSRARSRP